MYSDSDGDYFGSLELFNVSTGALITTLNTSANYWVSQVAFSKDGTTLAVGGVSSTVGVVELWNYSTQKLITTLSTGATWGVNSLAFSADGKTLVVGGASQDSFGNLTGGVVEVWNPATAKLTKSISTSANVETVSVAVAKDGSSLVDCGYSVDSSGNMTGILEYAAVSTGKVTQLATGENAEVDQVAYTPDGMTFAIAGGAYDSNQNQYADIEWWSVATLKMVGSYNPVSGAFASGVTFTPNSKSLVYCGVAFSNMIGVTGLVETVNLSTSASVMSVNTSPNGSAEAVAASPDGKTLAVATWSYDFFGNFLQSLQLVSAATGKTTRTLTTGASYGISALVFSADGKKLAVFGYNDTDTIVEVWSISSSSAKLTKTITSTAANSAYEVVFSPDGSLVADVGLNVDQNGNSIPVIEVWNASTGKASVKLKTISNYGLFAVAFSPDGKTLVAGGATVNSKLQTLNSTLEMWTVATGKSVKAPATNIGSSINALAYSPDGKTLAVGGTNSGGVVEFWTVSTLKLLNSPQLVSSQYGINSIVYTANGGAVLIGTDSALIGVNTSNYGLAGYYEQNTEGGVYSLYVSPDASSLGYVRSDGTLVVGSNAWTGK
jgi:WD40 repeat protein